MVFIYWYNFVFFRYLHQVIFSITDRCENFLCWWSKNKMKLDFPTVKGNNYRIVFFWKNFFLKSIKNKYLFPSFSTQCYQMWVYERQFYEQLQYITEWDIHWRVIYFLEMRAKGPCRPTLLTITKSVLLYFLCTKVIINIR